MKDSDDNFWVFVDETGTVDFQDEKNPYFGLGFLGLANPQDLSWLMSQVKYDMWEYLSGNKNRDGYSIDFFHAKDLPTPAKKAIFTKFEEQDVSGFKYNFLYIHKSEVYDDYFKFVDSVREEKDFDKLIEWTGVANRNFFQTYYTLIIKYFIEVISKANPDFNKKVYLVLSVHPSIKEKDKKTIANFVETISKKNKLDVKTIFTDNRYDYCLQFSDLLTWIMSRKINKFKKWKMWCNLISDYETNMTDITQRMKDFLGKKSPPPMESSFRRET